MKNGKRWIGMILTAILLLSIIPATVFAASGFDKTTAVVGGNLIEPTEMEAITLTLISQDLSLTLTATQSQSTQSGDKLHFSYSGATTGENQYVSCIFKSGTESLYYGKLADCADSSAASGDISIPLAGVVDGTYTVQVFAETDSPPRYTDYASTPVTMTVTVAGGVGTVSNFGGTVVNNPDATSIVVKTAPTKTVYQAGEGLDLSGLVLTVAYEGGSTEDVSFADFSTKGIASTPAHGSTLAAGQNTVTITMGNLSTSFAITVNPAGGQGYNPEPVEPDEEETIEPSEQTDDQPSETNPNTGAGSLWDFLIFYIDMLCPMI